MTNQTRLERAAEAYASRRFSELRGITPDEFTWKDLQYGRELLMMFQAYIAGAGAEFLKWNKANGKVLSGLTRRRNAERNLFIGERLEGVHCMTPKDLATEAATYRPSMQQAKTTRELSLEASLALAIRALEECELAYDVYEARRAGKKALAAIRAAGDYVEEGK